MCPHAQTSLVGNKSNPELSGDLSSLYEADETNRDTVWAQFVWLDVMIKAILPQQCEVPTGFKQKAAACVHGAAVECREK